ncbi:MAG: hypothetical protein OQK73_08220 [Gammaproteobacteria bacterium]|nr:hypothetical protein [Gammaproteobacteria bacterium]
MLVILILAAIYFIWLGFGLRKAQRYIYSWIAWGVAALFVFLITGASLKII